MYKKNAFSLVELAIVLVILGLLAGGVLSGQSLIRAAELRSVSTDVTRLNTAIYSFRDKYFYLPGDMPNAVKFWGAAAGGTADGTDTTCIAIDNAHPSTDQKTCNGNGDSMIAINSAEEFRAWQQLANAGLIEGHYTGVTGALNAGDFDAGINTPKLRTGSDHGVSLLYFGSVSPSGSYMFPGDYGNSFTIGECNTRECEDNAYKPEDAWNIDQKLDDGKPGTGKLKTRVGAAGLSSQAGCNNATDDSVAQASAATYTLTNNATACAFYYTPGF